MITLVGGSGFIGSQLAERLVEQGNKVTVVSLDGLKVTDGTSNVAVNLYVEPLPEAIVRESTDVVILIGQTGAGFNPEKELGALTNAVKDLKSGTQKVYYCSTVLVYGQGLNHHEGSPCRPIGAYPKFKLAAENLLKEHIPSHRLVIFRLANVYGNVKNRGIIGLLMNRVVGTNNETLTLNGDGKISRDYILIDDVVSSIVTVLNNRSSRGTINVATGNSLTIVEVLKTVEKVSGKTIAFQLTPDMPEEAATVSVSNDRIRTEFSIPKFATLEMGLKITLNRYKQI